MKYALVNDVRQEAKPGLSAVCPGCGNPMVAKCGEKRIWHWSHLVNRNCDYEWENETDWHRAWKNQFPEPSQEVRIVENGEIHIADVKTDQGWVIEFQHSYLKPEIRRTRDKYYKKLVWVVDGTRRKRDIQQINDTLRNGVQVVPNLPIYKVSLDKNTLLKEWVDSGSLVFFDFAEGPRLWWLLPNSLDSEGLFVVAVFRAEFLEIHRGGATQKNRDFEELLKDFSKIISDYNSILRAQARKPIAAQINNNYPIKDFIYWRTKILEADQLTVLEKVGKALAKYKSQTKTLGIKEALTEDQLVTLRKIYSDKLKLFKDAG